MRSVDEIRNTPIPTQKSVRQDVWRGLTSAQAGTIIPLAYVPILREDAVQRGQFNISLTMRETLKTLMNSVNVTVYAHFVPFTAFERFHGSIDTLNRSYAGQPEPQNNVVVPFIVPHAFSLDQAIYKTLGIQFPAGKQINSAVAEAYNTLVNYRYRARSPKLPQRGLYASSLAKAFWRNPMLWHIVPDFDQAMIDGVVELEFDQSRAPLVGLGVGSASSGTHNVGTSTGATGDKTLQYIPDATKHRIQIQGQAGASLELHKEMYTDLANAGIKVTLSNIELAKQTAAFAKMREAYSGVEDDYLIDMLMNGLRVPDEALKRPMLLAKNSTIFGYSRRRATDGDNLDKSLTDGITQLGLTYRVPQVNTGGIVMITCEIVPEALFERLEDDYLSTTDVDDYPSFLRDFLDPEKVDVVKNSRPDTLHSNPNGVFGYEPLNQRWKRDFARIGGKYYRPANDAWTEDRASFWSPQTLNPELTEDFYLVSDLPNTIFADSLADPFEITTQGLTTIVGNTVFGRELEEDEGNFEAVLAMVDTTRIVQE